MRSTSKKPRGRPRTENARPPRGPRLNLAPGGGISAAARKAFNSAGPAVKARIYLALAGLVIGEIGNRWTPQDRLTVATALVAAEFSDGEPVRHLLTWLKRFEP